MDFGRINNFALVDYALPADHKSLAKVLGGVKARDPKLYVGGVMWADEGFKGLIYPEKAKAADYVKYYTRQFNTIELNATHYRIPDADTFKRWYDVAPAGFKFCPKVNQEISHAGNLFATLPFHNQCNGLFQLLRDKLGTCFMQLPPQFGTSRLSELLEFLDHSNLRNLAIELRHESWYRQEAELNLLCNYLYKNGMSLIITDTPGRRDVLHMRLTDRTAMLRFNANNDHPTDRSRMDEWVQRFKIWFDNGLEELYFFMHSPDQRFMPQLVSYFIRQMQQVCGISIALPAIKQNSEPETLF